MLDTNKFNNIKLDNVFVKQNLPKLIHVEKKQKI